MSFFNLSSELERNGREGLDHRWVLVPGGGITKLPAFLTLFGANDMKVAVLVDSSVSTSDSVVELKKAGKLYDGGIVQVGDALGRDEADVEDLLDPEMYLGLVNRAYAGSISGKPITVADLAGSGRISKDVAAVFAARSINNGKVNHFAPAGALLREHGHSDTPKEVLDRAEKLIRTINALLPKG